MHSQGSSVRPSNMASQADATLVKYCQATRRLKAWSGGAGEREDKASGHLHGHLPPETSPDPSVAVAWPDLPGSITVDTSKVAPASPSGPDTPRPTVSLPQKPDTVFLQRPGVNIRSAPSTNAGVVGKAPKGMRFKVTNREGDWVQVESAQFSGWIKSQFLAANKPGRGALHRGGRVNARLRLWYYY